MAKKVTNGLVYGASVFTFGLLVIDEINGTPST